MKRVFAALLTFSIGVSGWNLLKPEISEFRLKAVEAPKYPPTKIYSYENYPSKKVRKPKPFFDSFIERGDDEETAFQNFSGWFMPDKFKGMREVWTIKLNGESDEKTKNKKMIWTARILTTNADDTPNDDDDFHSAQIKTEGSRLSFKTNKIRGIEYRFDGKFLAKTVKGKSFADDEKVLRGTMQKIVRGKQVAKFTADFAYYEPRCYH